MPQFLLTAEEMSNLVSVREVEVRDAALDKARVKLLEVTKFGCIHEQVPGTGGRRRGGYCDDCPTVGIEHLCRKPKNWSK
jgi:hypothetical protein